MRCCNILAAMLILISLALSGCSKTKTKFSQILGPDKDIRTIPLQGTHYIHVNNDIISSYQNKDRKKAYLLSINPKGEINWRKEIGSKHFLQGRTPKYLSLVNSSTDSLTFIDISSGEFVKKVQGSFCLQNTFYLEFDSDSTFFHKIINDSIQVRKGGTWFPIYQDGEFMFALNQEHLLIYDLVRDSILSRKKLKYWPLLNTPPIATQKFLLYRHDSGIAFIDKRNGELMANVPDLQISRFHLFKDTLSVLTIDLKVVNFHAAKPGIKKTKEWSLQLKDTTNNKIVPHPAILFDENRIIVGQESELIVYDLKGNLLHQEPVLQKIKELVYYKDNKIIYSTESGTFMGTLDR